MRTPASTHSRRGLDWMIFLSPTSLLPLIGENLATTIHQDAALWMSGAIIVPQIVVALLAPWVGFHSEKRGRRPLLLIGFGIEPIRAILLAFTTGYPLLMLGQILKGISGATIGVLTVLVITDLTAGTGRFNLAVGAVGAISGIAASISTSATGFLFLRSAHRLSAACRHRRRGHRAHLGVSGGDQAGKV